MSNIFRKIWRHYSDEHDKRFHHNNMEMENRYWRELSWPTIVWFTTRSMKMVDELQRALRVGSL